MLARDLEAGGLHAVAREHRPAGRVRHASARSRGPCGHVRRIPASTPEATKPFAAVTLIPTPRCEAAGRRVSAAARGRGSRSASPGRRRPCRGCPRRRSTIVRPLGGSAKTPSSTPSVCTTRAISGHDALRQHPHDRRSPAYAASSSAARRPPIRRARNRSRAGRGGSAAGAGRSAGAKPSIMLASRARAGARPIEYGLKFSSTAPAMRRLARASGRRRTCPTSRRRRPSPVDDVAQRREREQRRGRVAAGVRDQPARRRLQLGQARSTTAWLRLRCSKPYHCG